MADIVTLLILLYTCAITFIGVAEGIMSVSTVLRLLMFMIPIFVFDKKKLAFLSALGCESFVIALRAILIIYLQRIKFLGDDGVYGVHNVLLRKPTGLLDFITVTLYFIVLCFVIYCITKERLCNVNKLSDIKIRQKREIDNYLMINVIATITFFITGIWDYNLKDSLGFVALYSIAFFVIYIHSKKLIDSLYLESIDKFKKSDKYVDYSDEVRDLDEW